LDGKRGMPPRNVNGGSVCQIGVPEGKQCMSHPLNTLSITIINPSEVIRERFSLHADFFDQMTLKILWGLCIKTHLNAI